MKKLLILITTILLTVVTTATGQTTQNEKKWKVIVSITDQKTYVFENTKLIRAMICSTGLKDGDNDTPLGNYILNESGQKRGKFFFSKKVQEGARWWVGFIGGVYLFHSIPVTEDNKIIAAEAAKLGKPASHGCIRLSMDNAHWFYSTVPNGALVHIQKDAFFLPHTNIKNALLTKTDITNWLFKHEHEYYQQHLLSCEAALTRLSLAIMGIKNIDEDTILYSFPWGKDPETSFVCDNVDQGRRNKDGSIHWNNYGAHPPVVISTLKMFMKLYGISSLYEVKEMKLSDEQLKNLIKNNDHFLGAIVWLVGHPERWGSHPKVNSKGLVLGEHVRFVDPELDENGKFMIWDPEKHPNLPYHQDSIPTRDMFNYRTVVLLKK